MGDAPVREGDAVTAAVNAASRRRAKANHTATHLLQSALKLVVGEDVSQAGSLVTFDRLRFDFNAPRAPTSDELRQIEALGQRLGRGRRRAGRARDAHRRGQGKGRHGDVRREVRRCGARG
jgi:alanyl-tRNA synthetase